MSKFQYASKLALAVSCLVGPTLAAQTREPVPDRFQLMTLMHTFEAEFTRLRPHLVSDVKFSAADARAEIRSSLETLEKAVTSIRPPTIEKNPSLNLTFSLMSHHLQRTKASFDQGALELTRRHLNATTNFCMNCHTQLPVAKANLGGLALEASTEPVTFESAESAFITRRFDVALERYDELARKYPASGLDADRLVDVYNRKIALFARVQRDPKAGVTNFKKDLENEKLPVDVRSNLKVWITEFEKWQSEKVKLDRLSNEALLSWISKNRPEPTRQIAPSDPQLVTHLRLSGLLYERLTKDPNGKDAQEILYGLALYEKKLAKLYWYSMYPSYLRECVLKFPKKPLTKTCYDLYESDLMEQFAGRSPIPESLKSGLEVLKRQL